MRLRKKCFFNLMSNLSQRTCWNYTWFTNYLTYDFYNNYYIVNSRQIGKIYSSTLPLSSIYNERWKPLMVHKTTNNNFGDLRPLTSPSLNFAIIICSLNSIFQTRKNIIVYSENRNKHFKFYYHLYLLLKKKGNWLTTWKFVRIFPIKMSHSEGHFKHVATNSFFSCYSVFKFITSLNTLFNHSFCISMNLELPYLSFILFSVVYKE